MGGSCTYLMHAQGKEQKPHVSRSLICPLLFYMRRSVALWGTALDSRAYLCYFPRSLASKFFFFSYLSTISSFFEKETRKDYIGRKLNNFDEKRVIIELLELLYRNRCSCNKKTMWICVNLSINIVFMDFNNFEI